MATVKRITANLPEGLLEEALQVNGKGATETLVEGFNLRQTRAYQRALKLKGKIQLDIDLKASRERSSGRHLRMD